MGVRESEGSILAMTVGKDVAVRPTRAEARSGELPEGRSRCDGVERPCARVDTSLRRET